jgi:hypothetical protein
VSVVRVKHTQEGLLQALGVSVAERLSAVLLGGKAYKAAA